MKTYSALRELLKLAAFKSIRKFLYHASIAPERILRLTTGLTSEVRPQLNTTEK